MCSMAGSIPVSPSAKVVPTVRRRARQYSPALDAWRRFRRHRLAVLSGAILLTMVLAIALAPLLWRAPINEIDFTARLAGPSWQHPLGTDDVGQDLRARILYGGRISIAVGLTAMIIAVLAGTIIGAVAGMS